MALSADKPSRVIENELRCFYGEKGKPSEEKADNIRLPLVLRPSRTDLALELLLSSSFVGMGILMILGGEEASGYFTAFLCGPFMLLCGIRFHPNADYLRLDSNGFAVCDLFRIHTVRWAHIREFGIIVVGIERRVGWNLIPDQSRSGGEEFISETLRGYEGGLPDTYDIKAQHLANLMSILCRRYGNPNCTFEIMLDIRGQDC